MKPTTEKPIVVGIYGVPGSGKTFLLRALQETPETLLIFEGSEVIDSIIPGGLAVFKALPETEKTQWRELAISKIREDAVQIDSMAVVSGHFMFWPEEHASGTRVITQGDLDIYTHILYLDVPAETVVERRDSDPTRVRPQVSIEHIRRWQKTEMAELQEICGQNGILFARISCAVPETVTSSVERLLCAFQSCKEESFSETTAEETLKTIIDGYRRDKLLEKFLVFDADKTLAAQDTGSIFWGLATHHPDTSPGHDPLKALFGGPMKYSKRAFLQAALMYTEAADYPANHLDFIPLYEKVASSVTLRPEFLALLRHAVNSPSTGVVVVTCGLQRVWELVLERVGLSNLVRVIGTCLPCIGHYSVLGVVTPKIKSSLVSQLRNDYQLTVWAFGDSVIDIPMLTAANHAIVVAGGPSKSMEEALDHAINHSEYPLRRARQVVFPHVDGTITPRLNTDILPIVDVTSPTFLHEVLGTPPHPMEPHANGVYHATGLAASKILATPQRDARMSGHALRAAHQRAGWYLSMTLISDILGVEEIPGGIPHVQGNMTTGHRLRNEEDTLIIALMRGGEPMALGVSEAFPAAGFLHAKNPIDLKEEHLSGVKIVLLVDSVVNSGKSVVEFVEHIRGIGGKGVRIVVVAGVVQAGAVQEEAVFGAMLKADEMLEVVMLRMSDNKFTGRRGTDTGNRLFNTTRLE